MQSACAPDIPPSTAHIATSRSSMGRESFDQTIAPPRRSAKGTAARRRRPIEPCITPVANMSTHISVKLERPAGGGGR